MNIAQVGNNIDLIGYGFEKGQTRSAKIARVNKVSISVYEGGLSFTTRYSLKDGKCLDGCCNSGGYELPAAMLIV